MNRSKIRPDVFKLIEGLRKDQMEGITEFLGFREDQSIDFQNLWKRVMDGNALFFKNRGISEDLTNLVNREEMLLLAKMHRFTSDYVADLDQKKYPIPKDVRVETIDAGGIPAEWQTVPSAIDCLIPLG